MNGFGARLKRFADIIYEPKQHLFFAAIWYLSISGLFVLFSEQTTTWRVGVPTLLAIVTFFLVLFVLRAIDEVKDFEYDKVHNLDRPLVCGAVTRADITTYVVLGLLLLVAINWPVSPYLALFVTLNIGYGLLLMKLEQWIPLMGKSLFFNLLITYPVSIALSFYTLLQTHLLQAIPVNSNQLLLIGCYVLAFLHFEIVRKSMWRNLSEPSEMLYSNEIGTVNALVVATVTGLGACLGLVFLNQPWQLSGVSAVTGWFPLLNVVFILLSLKLFIGNRQQRFNPRKFSVPFIVGFYLFNLIHAFIGSSIQMQIW